MATKTMIMDMPGATASSHQLAVRNLFGKMDTLFKQMRRDQVEIEKSQKRTRAALMELRAMGRK